MARINIETTLFLDGRYQDFMIKVGDRHKAMGIILDLYMIAQKYWVPNQFPIPMAIFQSIPYHTDLVSSALVERINDDHVYVKGSKEQFNWLIQRSKAGRENIRKFNLDTRSSRLDSTTSLLSSLSSLLSSPNKNLAQNEFERIYQLYPRKLGKQNGIKKLQTQIKTSEELALLEKALQNFLAYHAKNKTAPEYIPYFSTFVSSWKDWIDPETGTSSTQEKSTDYDLTRFT